MLSVKENKKWFGIMVAIIMCLGLLGLARADWQEQAKLPASDGAAVDVFGGSVSISGDYAIVGACADDDKGDGSGSAYIFKWNGTNWVQQQKLTASDGAAGDLFGKVSISGDYAIVGAIYADGNEPNCGSAYIFKREGESWVEQAKLTASDGAAMDYFGWGGVSISGDYAIVGANGDDDEGSNSGSAYIFKRVGENWIQQAKLTASDGTAEDAFGLPVSISGDYAVVGARFDDDNGSDSGSTYIFKRNGESWIQQAKLTASDGAALDQFSGSVSINGDYAIVGAYYDDDNGDDSGSAYIFKRDSANWLEQAKLTAADGAAGDWFGVSVSIKGDYAIIGARHDDDNGTDSGSAYIFKRNGLSRTQVDKLTASDGEANDKFGVSVSIDGHYAIVGAFFDDDNGTDSGSAYIFRRVCPTADLSGDCFVDWKDFVIMAGQWLQGN